MSFEIGVGRTSITPKRSVMLAGFAAERWSNNVRDELSAKVIALRWAEREVLVIALDLIWVSRSLRDEIVKKLAAAFGLEPDAILVACTHTHSGPEVRENTFYPPRPTGEYRNYLIGQVCLAVQNARNDLATGSVSRASRCVPLAINRRKRQVDLAALRKGKFRTRMSNRPNPAGHIDTTLETLWLFQEDKLAAIMVNFACHPTLLRGQEISADYPGAIEKHLRTDHGLDADVVFLQGFAANLNPRRIRRLPFAFWPLGRLAEWIFDREQFDREVAESGVEELAAGLAEQCMAMRRVPVDVSVLRARLIDVELPVDHDSEPSKQDISPGHEAEYRAHAKALRLRERNMPFRIQVIEIGDKYLLVALEGEIFSEFAIWLREEFSNRFGGIMAVSCANGMVGYIPTDDALAEGGYEPSRSISMFGQPGRFAVGVERVLKSSINAILQSN